MTTDLTPGTDLAVIDPAVVEAAADPAQYVVQACERAKTWLAHALEHGGIEDIVELKSQAEAIRIYTMQKQLGKDAELSAAEIVRRAERGLGLAIRRGQAVGEIENLEEARSRAGRIGRGTQQTDDIGLLKPKPADYATEGELNGNGAGIYHMTDGVTEEQFEAAIGAGKSERNLSRANVVRKVREVRSVKPAAQGSDAAAGDAWVPDVADRSTAAIVRRIELIRELAGKAWTSQQIADRLGIPQDGVRKRARDNGIVIPADEVLGRGTRKTIDSNRIVRETVNSLEGLEISLDLVNFDDLDRSEIENWTVSLTASIRVLNRLNKQLKEMVQ